jgi:hypothetical protein
MLTNELVRCPNKDHKTPGMGHPRRRWKNQFLSPELNNFLRNFGNHLQDCTVSQLGRPPNVPIMSVYRYFSGAGIAQSL